MRKNGLGFSFTKEYPLGPYFLDFYCRKLKLNVEVDGEQHLGSCESDRRRDAFLHAKGIKVIRISSLDCTNNLEGVAIFLLEACKERAAELE